MFSYTFLKNRKRERERKLSIDDQYLNICSTECTTTDWLTDRLTDWPIV